MKVLAIIPARGGSKGVPRKNVRLLAGKPLIAHTIGQALGSARVTRTVVSTNDDEIAGVAVQYGAEVIKRPSDISGDTAPSETALLHVLSQLEGKENYRPDIVVFLQCTSPVRAADDIDRALEKMASEGADSLLSVSPSHRFLWAIGEGGMAKPLNYDYRNRPRRQDMVPQYVENGSIYAFNASILTETGNRLGGKIALYVMPEEASFEIDSEFDLKVLEQLMDEKKGEGN